MADFQFFREIQEHLLHDAIPSIYLHSIANCSKMDKAPFAMLKRMQQTRQPPQHHPEGDVWNHTLMVVDEAAKIRHKSKDSRAFMWAALLHDIGKPVTTRTRKNKITSYGHDKAGAGLAYEFLSVFGQDKVFIDCVCNLVRYHMHILFVIKNLPFGDMAAMKKAVDMDELAMLGFCDRAGRKNADKKAEEENRKSFLRLTKI